MKRSPTLELRSLDADSRRLLRKRCLPSRAMRAAALTFLLVGGLPIASQAQTPQLLFWSSFSDATTTVPPSDLNESARISHSAVNSVSTFQTSSVMVFRT